MRATEVPPGFPIASVTRTIDYGKARLGNRDVWLPRTAEDIVEHRDHRTSINRTEFSHCRQYGAVSSLSFESPPPGSDDAATGDPITARVTIDVRGKTGLLVPKGALAIFRKERPDSTPCLRASTAPSPV